MSKTTIVAGLLLLLVALVHAPAVTSWWTYDDPQLLLFAKRYTIVETFFEPEKYQTLATHAFTPLLPLSLEVDVIGGSGDARLAYLHQLALLALATTLFATFLGNYTSRNEAVLAAALFATSWMVTYAARTLMIRHYVEGLVFALGALLVWRRRRSPGTAVAGALLYLAAMLEKEIYAPLPLLLIAMDIHQKTSWRGIAKRLTAPSIAAAIYIAWRLAMIGSTGYVIGVTGRDLLHLPLSILRSLSFGTPIFPAALLLIVVAALVVQLRSAAGALMTLLIVTFVALPTLPLAGNFEWRYGFIASAAIIFFVPLALRALRLTSRARTAVLALLVFTSLVLTRVESARHARLVAPLIAEGRYVWNGSATAPPLLAKSPAWYLAGIRDLRTLDRAGTPPRFFASRFAFLLGAADPSRAVEVSTDGSIVPVTGEQLSSFDLLRRDETIRFAVELSRRNHIFSWQFHGPDGASWTFVNLPEYAQYQLPKSGSRGVPRPAEQQYCVIVVILPDGRWSASEPLAIPTSSGSTRWSTAMRRRNAAA